MDELMWQWGSQLWSVCLHTDMTACFNSLAQRCKLLGTKNETNSSLLWHEEESPTCDGQGILMLLIAGEEDVRTQVLAGELLPRGGEVHLFVRALHFDVQEHVEQLGVLLRRVAGVQFRPTETHRLPLPHSCNLTVQWKNWAAQKMLQKPIQYWFASRLHRWGFWLKRPDTT